MKQIWKGKGIFQHLSPALLSTLVLAGLLLCSPAQKLQAQTQTAASDSIVQITADAQGLPLVSPDQLPRYGTFWLVMPGGPNACSWVPMPTPPFDAVPVYQVADGQFIVDGTIGQASPTEQLLNAQSNAIVSLIYQIQGAQTQPMTMTSMDSSSIPSPGGTNSGSGGYGDYGLTNNPFYNFNTNLLWLQITNVYGGMAYANLYNATNQVYAIWSTPDLTMPFSFWSVETEVFPTTSTTNVFPFTVSTLGRPDLFLRAQDWTGVQSNGLYCWWTWYYFHTLDLSWTDLDANGNMLGYDYTNHYDPNTITFTIAVTNTDVNTAHPVLPLNVTWGIPGFVAVLANDTNLNDAVWLPYTNSSVVATLGADGNYTVAVGLRGFPTNATETWEAVDLVKNSVPPQLTVTTPVSGTVSQMTIQVQGFASKALATLTYDLSNASGTISNLPAFLTGQFYDTGLMAFTTNYFQSDDINLAAGTNIITLHATDWAGNQTNVSLTLNYPVDLPPLRFVWPLSGAVVGGRTFTLQARANYPGLNISATVGSTTVQGVVEPNGTVWLQNLPLAAGTNTVTLTASDANGNLTTTNLSVVENNVGLGVDDVTTDEPNETGVDVTGEIGSSSLDVYVNGVPAENYGDGTWEAWGVPVNPAGTAVFSVQVSNNTVVVASQNFYQAQPPMVALMSYSGHRNFIDTAPLPYPDSTYSDAINWFYQTGGSWIDNEQDEGNLSSATNGLSLLLDAPWNTDAYSSLPWEFAAISVLVTNGFIVPQIYQSRIQTRTMIIPSGMEQAGTTNLYLVLARACEFSDTNIQGGLPGYAAAYWNYASGVGNNINGYLPYGGDVGLPPEWLQINGHPLVNTGITNVLSSTNGGPSISSVWGATIVSGPAGQPLEVTPVATRVYKNWDVTLDQNVYPIHMQILDANGNDLTLQTNTVIVGQQMNLTCQISFTNSFYTNTFTATNFQWTVPGFVISNYVVAPDTNSATVVTNFPTTNSAVKYYWANGGSNRVVCCSATVNGATVSGQATFNVLCPTADLLGYPGPGVTVDANYYGLSGVFLHYGTEADLVTQTNWGMKFYATNIVLNGCPSTASFMFVQVGMLQAEHNYTNGTSEKFIGSGLDQFFPAESFSASELWWHFYDSPGESVDTSAQTWRADNFTMYLLYQISGSNSVPVPIKKLDWSWSGIAQTNGSGWRLTSSNTNLANVNVVTGYPQWANQLTNGITTTSNHWINPFP